MASVLAVLGLCLTGAKAPPVPAAAPETLPARIETGTEPTATTRYSPRQHARSEGLFGVPFAAAFAPVLSVTKDDQIIGGDGDGQADPGDTIRYTIVVTNTGNGGAADVVFTDTLTPDYQGEVVFTLVVINAGPSQDSGVVTDALPSGLVYVSDDGGGARDRSPTRQRSSRATCPTSIPDSGDPEEDDQASAMIVASASAKAAAVRGGNAGAGTPGTVVLEAGYPNPFNPSVSIPFGLPEVSEVRIVVYNLLGQEVAVLVEGALEAGRHEVV